MGYSNENGYTPLTFNEIMSGIRAGVNVQLGTNYTEETFVGTNLYKYFYALVQRIQENEVKTAEIFAKLQQYFIFTNEEILDAETTPDGIIQGLAAIGYEASVKKMIEEDAGKANICVNVDDTDPEYADMKLAICQKIKDIVPAGIVTLGSESETITLSNGQSFDFKYHLPDITNVWLKLTITLSNNNTGLIGSVEDTKNKLIENIGAMYRLGLDFEPERYFTIADAPWASDIELEYSVDEGENYTTAVFNAAFDDLFVILLENISVVEV